MTERIIKIEDGRILEKNGRICAWVNRETKITGVLIRCEDCRFFLDNWKCMTWHMFVRPDGYCFRAKRKPDADESV